MLSRFFAAAILSVIALPVIAGLPPLRVAISVDIPPYVIDGATSGLEVEILERALPGYQLSFVQMSYNQLSTILASDGVEVAAGIGGESSLPIALSDDFVRFANFAISKRAEGLKVDDVSDLAGKRVTTWGGAYRVLGEGFEAMFAPGGPYHADYVEFADQREQVADFWGSRGSVVVIDRAIFTYFTHQLGHEATAAEMHAVFAPVTPYKVGFKDEAVRDAFNRGLASLCADGSYLALLEKYHVDREESVCVGR